MSFFNKLFGTKAEEPKNHNAIEKRSVYMPEKQLPEDERFMTNFKVNGGKFLYCDSLSEVHKSLGFILEENDWQNSKALVFDDRLKTVFTRFKSNSTKIVSESSFFLTTCESLIADDGSLLLCSNQIAEKKLKELPNNFIVYATTSQFVKNIGEGLKDIKQKNKSKIPSNITTIKYFKTSENEDFLSYGRSSKNLYLLLLEDL